MNIELLSNVLKYLIVGVLVYSLFTYIPKQKMDNNDVLLIAVTIVLLYIGFDNLQNLFSKNSTSDAINCNKYCSVPNIPIENFSTMMVKAEIPQENKLVPVESKPIQPSQPSSNVVSTTTQNDGTVIQRNTDGSYNISPENSQYIARGEKRSESGVLTNELKYDKEYNFYDLSILPITTNKPDELFESGYSYLPPKDWYPVPPRPPICVTNSRSTVCPALTTGLGVDLKEWNESRRVTGPDSINTEYVKDKLNSGR
jgi:hypothetical protein